MVPMATNFSNAARRACSIRCSAHHQVLVEEPARVVAVGADPADHGGQMEDHVGCRGLEQAYDRGLVQQIELALAWDGDRTAAQRPQAIDDEGAQETGAARHDHAPIPPVRATCVS